MKIEYRKSAAATPAFALIAEGWNDLVQEGLMPDLLGVCPVDWRNEVLHAERDDGEIAGVLCFVSNPETDSFVVTLAYVEPTSRRQGVFGDLYKALRVRTAERKVAKIVFSIHRDNAAAHEVLKRFAVSVSAVVYETFVET